MKRKRIVVGVALIAAFALYIVLSFIGNTTSWIDERFSLNRQLLPADVTEAMVMPLYIAGFRRKAVATIAPDAFHRFRGVADYVDSNGNGIMLTISDYADVKNDKQRAVILSYVHCGQLKGEAQLHLNATFPYSFGACSDWNFQQYDFTWFNGIWLIRVYAASTLQSDAETLLQFVNSYPF